MSTTPDPRLERLNEPHVAPLTQHVKRLREERGGGESVPFVDPDDAGIAARVLILLEAPGARAMGSGSPRPLHGSGFVSVSNNDPTARTTLACRSGAGLTARDCVHWNAIPWYIGDGSRIRAARAGDLVEALPAVHDFVRLLPDLRVAVLMGRKAEDGWSRLITRYPDLADMPHLFCPHPSARSVNRPGARDKIISTLTEAAVLAGVRAR